MKYNEAFQNSDMTVEIRVSDLVGMVNKGLTYAARIEELTNERDDLNEQLSNPQHGYEVSSSELDLMSELSEAKAALKRSEGEIRILIEQRDHALEELTGVRNELASHKWGNRRSEHAV